MEVDENNSQRMVLASWSHTGLVSGRDSLPLSISGPANRACARPAVPSAVSRGIITVVQHVSALVHVHVLAQQPS